MSVSKTYEPVDIENKWYAYWLKNQLFRSTSDFDAEGKRKEAYTVVIPPPNVTGVLHMGHMLNNTIQDILVRRARMLGKNACWVPGTDHASIATEAKVVSLLRDEGKSKEETGREQFLLRAFEWKEKYGGIILEQLKLLGASCDWERTRFTMEPDLNYSVQKVFVDFYEKGLIYRGVRMVNWDSAGRTAVSDEEVVHRAVTQRLYYIRYPLSDGTGDLVVATARPETIMADAAIAVNPQDTRYRQYVGKHVVIPLINAEIPIIEDGFVSMDFGTGCLKVTPAHSLQDYDIGLRHKLPVKDILNEDGTLNASAQIYVGEDRFIARKRIARELEEKGYLTRVEDHQSQVGFSERTDSIIEPRLSAQWFLDMKTLAKPALDAVTTGEVKLFPARFMNTYRHWMENVHDWCISRQLWWGQQIPVWYNEEGDFVVAMNESEARQKFINAGLLFVGLKQEEDVVDTWFSSWLWPITVFDGITSPGNQDIKYYYPTNDLVTAPEILFFWVARMIMAGQELMHAVPFRNVYLTGIIRDKLGRKMSKSLGNSPDPLDLIRKFGADAVRTGLLLSSPAGNDLIYDEALTEQGRNFANKIWNAFRLVKGWEEGQGTFEANRLAPAHASIVINHFKCAINKVIKALDSLFAQYRLSDALMMIYKLVWDDFCSWFLELAKPVQSQQIDPVTLGFTKGSFEIITRLLHPFMPFITEELWQEFRAESAPHSVMLAQWPMFFECDLETEADYTFVESHVRPLAQQLRHYRNANEIAQKTAIELWISARSPRLTSGQEAVVTKAANLLTITRTQQKLENATSVLISDFEYFIVGAKTVDRETEIRRIQEELSYAQGFLKSVTAKLANEKFLTNAKPEIVDVERRKLTSATDRILKLEKNLSSLLES